MDKEQEQKYLKQIADLENEKKEFAEKIRVADEAKAKEAEKVADTQLRATISEFCATNKLNTNKHKDLKIEEILFAAAKANQTIEFATKPSEGGGIPSIATEKKPLFVVLQDALKSFQIATPPEGEMHEFNQSFPDNKKNDKSSMRIQQAEEYAKSHPAEFSECENDTQKIAKALRLEINQQIQFKPIQ